MILYVCRMFYNTGRLTSRMHCMLYSQPRKPLGQTVLKRTHVRVPNRTGLFCKPQALNCLDCAWQFCSSPDRRPCPIWSLIWEGRPSSCHLMPTLVL